MELLDNKGKRLVSVMRRCEIVPPTKLDLGLLSTKNHAHCLVIKYVCLTFPLAIKTHGSVSCGPRSRRATAVSILTGRTKTSFSHHFISVITYPIGTNFATQLPASQGSLHSKFEGNSSDHFRDTSRQSFVFFSSSSSFRTLAKIAITSKRVL